MSDERIHRHDWENGRCKTCGVERQKAESSLPPAHGWKHEPVSSEQLKALLECAEAIKWKLTIIGLFVVFIWITLMFR